MMVLAASEFRRSDRTKVAADGRGRVSSLADRQVLGPFADRTPGASRGTELSGLV